MIKDMKDVEICMRQDATQIKDYLPDLGWSYTDHHGHEHKWVKVDENKYEVPSCVMLKVKEYNERTEKRELGYNYYCSQCMEHIEPPKTLQTRWIPVNKRIEGVGKIDRSVQIGEEIDLSFISWIKEGKAEVTAATLESSWESPSMDICTVEFKSTGEVIKEED